MCDRCDRADSDYGVGSMVAIAIRQMMHPPTPEQVRAERERQEGLVRDRQYRTLVEALWVGFGGSLEERCSHCGQVLPDDG